MRIYNFAMINQFGIIVFSQEIFSFRGIGVFPLNGKTKRVKSIEIVIEKSIPWTF